MRALVQRPRRKMHLAAHDGQQWVTFCDLLVVDDARTGVQPFETAGGATTALVAELWATISPNPQLLCAHCRRFVLLIEVLRADRLYPRRALSVSHRAAVEAA